VVADSVGLALGYLLDKFGINWVVSIEKA